MMFAEAVEVLHGRIHEMGIAEWKSKVETLEDQLEDTDDSVERPHLLGLLGEARENLKNAIARASHVAGVPPTHPTSAGGRVNWRKAWMWANKDGDILDELAPYNDIVVRNKPGELQGANIERVIAFLDVENNPRYEPALHNTEGRNWLADTNNDGTVTMCTVFVADATRILHAEIPLQPNRAANIMCSWLENASLNPASSGWRLVASPEEAQALANQGQVVVVTQRRSGAGHVALVRPVPETEALQAGGHDPHTAQAGAVNSSSTRVSKVFTLNAALDPKMQVKYYAHA
jgi:hypothetical protein